MKHGTRLLAAALSLVLCLGCLSVPAAAADQEEMLQVLALLSVMNGDGQGELHLDRTATRAEFVKMCVSASVRAKRAALPFSTRQANLSARARVRVPSSAAPGLSTASAGEKRPSSLTTCSTRSGPVKAVRCASPVDRSQKAAPAAFSSR